MLNQCFSIAPAGTMHAKSPATPRHRMRLVPGAALLAASLALPGQAQSAAAKVDPCSVLSAGEVRSALGAAPTGGGKRNDMGLVDSCDWTMPDGGGLEVTFYVTPVGAPRVSPRIKGDTKYEAVAGLGSQAVYKNDSSPAIPLAEIVEVVTGQQHFDVQYVNAATAKGGPSKDALIALARTILGRLP